MRWELFIVLRIEEEVRNGQSPVPNLFAERARADQFGGYDVRNAIELFADDVGRDVVLAVETSEGEEPYDPGGETGVAVLGSGGGW